jgi:RNA polymerase sigma-70 factor (ECF subfamily)
MAVAGSVVIIAAESAAPLRRESPEGYGVALFRRHQSEALPAAGDLAGLVARMAQGDEQALCAFYDLTLGKAYALALRIVRQSDAAEEVVEDAFFQSWREAGRYDAGRGNPMAWLLTMVRSRALDWLRRRDDAQTFGDPLEFEGRLGADENGPEEILAALERSSAVHAALLELSPQARQLVALAFFRGLTHEEIAAACRMPLGTVKTVLHRACAKMRERLAMQGAIL